MKFAHFFIDRPIFAAVLSIVIALAGGVAARSLPVAQYPPITPPTIQVACTYPGAMARVVADTVAAPIEQQVNGVEGMLYMSSQCTNDGAYNLTVTFKLGTDLNMAQVLVQNRVQLALQALPQEVRMAGVTTRKKSPDIMLVVNLVSPGGRYDQLYLSNYATLQVREQLTRVDGVGDVGLLGQQDYSMRVWVDPNKMAARGLIASDVVRALREQNVQVAAGQVGQPPVPSGQAFQYPMSTVGRLLEAEQFASIIVKTGANGEITRLRDVARTELGAKNRDISSSLGTKDADGAIEIQPTVGMGVFQLPGSNALDTADRVRAKMEELKKRFPAGVDYVIAHDTTPFISESITEVFHALRDAIILVALVVLVFLQNWRSTLIPLLAVPVAILGTFGVMWAFGFSLNNLSLFGLVLAIGIVVDDAIVVVEAVEHHIEHGMSPRDATRRAMDEVSGPVVAVALVLCAVFVPCAFISGITGQFFRQFALTIAASTAISAFNSLTLSPALSAFLLKPKGASRDPLTWLLDLALGWFFRLFNFGFGKATNAYVRAVGGLLRVSVVVLLVYGALLGLTYYGFTKVPTGFIPLQDKGYLLVNVQLPDSSSLERTQQAMAKAERATLETPGVRNTVGVSGQSFLLGANGSNFGSMFVILEPHHDRTAANRTADAIAARLRARVSAAVPEAAVSVFGAPPVSGLGNAGGFKVLIEDRGDEGPAALQAAVDKFTAEGNKTPGLVGLFSMYRANTPQLYVDVDRTQCLRMGVPLEDVFATLQVYMGGAYVNDFNRFGRTWQVNVQAEERFRRDARTIKQFQVRDGTGKMVPLSTVTDVENTTGPILMMRYNMYSAAAVNGSSAPGASTGQVIRTTEQLAHRELPRSMGYEWTEITYMQILAGNTAMLVFGLAVVLVFLTLAALYESWSLPLAVILVVPMCLLCSIAGVALAKQDVNIFTQIGFVVLVGLASKNAILIVEFAKAKREEGASAREATLEACRLRLRPILMTSFAFILGVVPLMVSTGAGAEMRRTLGIAVFSGMLGVTFFGIFLTPVFYFVIQWFARKPVLVAQAPLPHSPAPIPPLTGSGATEERIQAALPRTSPPSGPTIGAEGPSHPGPKEG